MYKKKVSVRNEDSVLIGMQDLTANKLFATATSSGKRTQENKNN